MKSRRGKYYSDITTIVRQLSMSFSFLSFPEKGRINITVLLEGFSSGSKPRPSAPEHLSTTVSCERTQSIRLADSSLCAHIIGTKRRTSQDYTCMHNNMFTQWLPWRKHSPSRSVTATVHAHKALLSALLMNRNGTFFFFFLKSLKRTKKHMLRYDWQPP